MFTLTNSVNPGEMSHYVSKSTRSGVSHIRRVKQYGILSWNSERKSFRVHYIEYVCVSVWPFFSYQLAKTIFSSEAL